MNGKTIISIICFLTILLPASYSTAYQATFQPRLTLRTEYTDNLERENRNEKDDIITTVSPGFTLSVFGQTQGLNLAYDPAYAWYRENSEYDSPRHTANLGIWKQATRNTRLYVNDAFFYTEDPGATGGGRMFLVFLAEAVMDPETAPKDYRRLAAAGPISRGDAPSPFATWFGDGRIPVTRGSTIGEPDMGAIIVPLVVREAD